MPAGAVRRELLAGARAELPLALAALPFGLIYGALAREAGLPPGAAVAMSSIVFAGSAQFIATQLFAAGAPAAAIVLTTLVVNLRHLLYGASLAPGLRPLGPGWKWLLGYLLTDEAYAVVAPRYAAPAPAADHRHWFFLGAGLTLWVGWQLSTVAGAVVAAGIPPAWELPFVLPLLFVAIVAPLLRDRAARWTAATAAIVAVAAWSLPLRAGLIAGAAAGIAAGLLAERR
jgi:4-azaleucine resistance transporter AzlC